MEPKGRISPQIDIDGNGEDEFVGNDAGRQQTRTKNKTETNTEEQTIVKTIDNIHGDPIPSTSRQHFTFGYPVPETDDTASSPNSLKSPSHSSSSATNKVTPQKSVCFHSVTGQPGSERKITNAVDCLQYMINGTTLVKVKASMRQYRRFYTLEEDLSIIRWLPSTKKSSKARLAVNNVREVRPGKNTEVLKNPDITGMYKEDCSFSIIYGDDFESIDLIALTPAEASIWVTGLNFLIGLIRSPDSLEGREKMREKWLLDVFEEADSEHKGMLDELETIALLKRLNERLCIKSLKQKIAEFEMSKKNGEQRGCISKNAFIRLFTQTATRPDIYFILVRFCGRDYMTVEELQLFLEGEQDIIGTSLNACQKLIDRYEPSDEARKQKQFLIDGFTQFLTSDYCDIFGTAPKRINQDMDQPLAHYYIASSYNTYLIEDQLKGPSSCEGYSRALLLGCRSVKIDVHDGPRGPLVYHGNTLTGKISLEDVLKTIRDFSFINSPYPVIIHFENHCSFLMQKEVAKLFRKILGEYLFLESDGIALIQNSEPNESSQIPTDSVSSSSSSEETQSGSDSLSLSSTSFEDEETMNFWSKLTPNKLMKKIIISGRKEVDISNIMNQEMSDEDEECHQDCQDRKKLLLCPELAEIITLVRVKPEIDSSNLDNPNLLHLSESYSERILQNNSEDLTHRNMRFMTVVTPDFSRIDSSNLNPIDLFNCGVQLISMNFQTNGQTMNLYRGWFTQNGSCGYVLKPPFLRNRFSTFNFRRKEIPYGLDSLNIRIKIISGQQLPQPKGTSLKANSVDPYVIIQCIGIPLDSAEKRTMTVSNDGHNPIFDESFEFNVYYPELALIRFLVLDDEFINDDFIGQLTVPVSSLRSGYRHVKLFNMNDEIIDNATLFVKISLTQRRCCKEKLKRKKSWSQKNDPKQTGLKHIDEQIKNGFAIVSESRQTRKNIERIYLELCDECSLPENANMAQCLRIITLRMASCPTVIGFKIRLTEYGYPAVQVTGELTARLNQTLATLERTLHESFLAIDHSHGYITSLSSLYKQLCNVDYRYEETPFQSDPNRMSHIIADGAENLKFGKSPESTKRSKCQRLCCAAATAAAAKKSRHRSDSSSSSSIKYKTVDLLIRHLKFPRKSDKAVENLLLNLTVIRTELDNLNSMKIECHDAFAQIERIAESLERIFEREHKIILRSNSYVIRELNNRNSIISQNSHADEHDSKQQQQPQSSGELRSILKKPSSPKVVTNGDQDNENFPPEKD